MKSEKESVEVLDLSDKGLFERSVKVLVLFALFLYFEFECIKGVWSGELLFVPMIFVVFFVARYSMRLVYYGDFRSQKFDKRVIKAPKSLEEAIADGKKA